MGHFPFNKMIIGSKEFNDKIEVIVDGYFDNRKLGSVKAVKELTGFGLKEAKDVVDNLWVFIAAQDSQSYSIVTSIVSKRMQGILEVQPENKQFEKNMSDFAKISQIAQDIADMINANPDIHIHNLMLLIEGITRNKLDR
jgi:septation ring formation regulator EzrA